LKAQDNLYTPPPVEKSTSLTFEEKPFSEKPKIARKTYFIIMALVCYTLSFGNLFQFSDKYWNLPISILGIPTSFILQIIGGICAVGAIYSTWKMILELKYAGRLHVLFMDAVFECMFGSVFAIPFLGDPVLFIFSLIIIYILLIAINLQT
jgi:phosphate/sulfate permease